MYKDILAAVVIGYKAEALIRVKPFYCTVTHWVPPINFFRTQNKQNSPAKSSNSNDTRKRAQGLFMNTLVRIPHYFIVVKHYFPKLHWYFLGVYFTFSLRTYTIRIDASPKICDPYKNTASEPGTNSTNSPSSRALIYRKSISVTVS